MFRSPSSSIRFAMVTPILMGNDVEWFPTFGLLWHSVQPPMMSCPRKRIARVVEWIARNAVQSGDVANDEGGVVEDGFAAADGPA